MQQGLLHSSYGRFHSQWVENKKQNPLFCPQAEFLFISSISKSRSHLYLLRGSNLTASFSMSWHQYTYARKSAEAEWEAPLLLNYKGNFSPAAMLYVSCYSSPNNAGLGDLLIWQINDSKLHMEKGEFYSCWTVWMACEYYRRTICKESVPGDFHTTGQPAFCITNMLLTFKCYFMRL